jgi:hypothetical protein
MNGTQAGKISRIKWPLHCSTQILPGGVFNWQIGNPSYPLCWRILRG